jgi:hypothetical protein
MIGETLSIIFTLKIEPLVVIKIENLELIKEGLVHVDAAMNDHGGAKEVGDVISSRGDELIGEANESPLVSFDTENLHIVCAFTIHLSLRYSLLPTKYHKVFLEHDCCVVHSGGLVGLILHLHSLPGIILEVQC